MIRMVFAVVLAVFAAAPIAAQERSYLGYGYLFTNDFLGDGKDRWRTGSYQSSRFWGSDTTGPAPDRFGQLLELRIGGEIIAPEELGRVVPGDRPYAGVLSFGLHTHFSTGDYQTSAGVDLSFTGSQTRLDSFQSSLHDVFGAPDLSSAVRDQQIGDDFHPSLALETARSFDLSARTQLRPYVEGRLGLENLLRLGADLRIGALGRDAVMSRDTVTGHRYQVGRQDGQGAAFILGADVAYVDDSELLPENRGIELSEDRTRIRSGVQWQTAQGFSGFYGLTWLSEEFDGQREGQVVGSLRLNFSF